MKVVALAKYASFQCMAGNCPSTCCAGWSILVDRKDFMRFQELEPEWLREDILSNIKHKDSKYYFQNTKDGKCAMLDQDGLCRIQRNTSEEMLCNTCRKYPRLIRSMGEILYLSMAASCPVVAEYLVMQPVEWNVIDDCGTMKNVLVGDLAMTKNAWSLFQEHWAMALEFCKVHSSASILYQCFEKMAAGILEILSQNLEGCISAESFLAFEKDTSGNVAAFLNNERVLWENIVDHYMNYRVFSRKIEYPEEKDLDCIRQAQGELFLLRTLAFSRFCENNTLLASDWQDLLQRVYRFSAHGEKVSALFQKMVREFFTQDVFWSFLLI